MASSLHFIFQYNVLNILRQGSSVSNDLKVQIWWGKIGLLDTIPNAL